MRTRRERIGHALFAIAWLGGLTLALRVGFTAYDVNPEQLLALAISTYLGAWGLFFFRSRMGPAGDGARFVACTTSILLVLTFVEAFAIFRLVDYRVLFSTPTPAWKRAGHLPDPDLLYIREGHQRVRRSFEGNELGRLRGAVPWQEYHCDLVYDRQGFRNTSDRSSSDVIVLGDSFIEGLHVSDDELLTSRLSASLGLTVTNLGRTGDGPQQELHVLRRYGLGLQPRTCVWAFYEGNDLGDADRYEMNRRHVAQASRERGTGLFYGRSFIRNSLAYVIRTWIHPEPRQPVARYTGTFVDRGGTERALYFGGDVRQADGGLSASTSELTGLKNLRSVLAEAQEYCQRERIDLVVVFIPTKFRIYRDLCKFEDEALCRSWPLDELPEVLNGVVKALPGEVGYVDLTGRLRREASRGALLYLPDDTHWSAAGHQVAAEVIAECLRTRSQRVVRDVVDRRESRPDPRSRVSEPIAASSPRRP
jgi:hypothetical protein